MRFDEMTIGELSRLTGCNIETIRYYERIGIVPKPLRRGRYRTYDSEDVGRLSFVRRARELGFTLGEVRALLGLTSRGEAACVEARNIAATHLAEVRRKIADLRGMETALAAAVRQCNAGAAPGCPLIDSLSSGRALAARSPAAKGRKRKGM